MQKTGKNGFDSWSRLGHIKSRGASDDDKPQNANWKSTANTERNEEKLKQLAKTE